MIRLYGFEGSTNVERVSLALAFKGLPTQWVVIDPADRAEVRKASGQDLVPVIKDSGNVIADSTAILHYLERHYPEPRLFPEDPARRAEVNVFVDWFNHVWKGPPNAIVAEMDKPTPDPTRIEHLALRMREALALFEAMLAGRDHLMGPFGAADVTAFPFLKHALLDTGSTHPFHRVLREHQPLGDGHPRLTAWIRRVNARPRA